MTESFDRALRDLPDDGFFSSSVHGLFSVEALCISCLIQETALRNIFKCQCHGLALLGASVDVVFSSVVLMFTLSYHSLSTTDATEQVFCMYEFAMVLLICFVCSGYYHLLRYPVV